MTNRDRPATLRPGRRSWTVAVIVLCVATGTLAWLGQQAQTPLKLAARDSIDVQPGDTLAIVMRRLGAAGQLEHPLAIRAWARLTGRGDRIVAGEYSLTPGSTAAGLLADFAAGRVRQHAVRVPEGARFRDLLTTLWASPVLTATLRDRTEADIMAALGAPGQSAEGSFLPDTYFVTRGQSDLDVLRRSHAAMQDRLTTLWQARGPGAPASMSQALTLASLVEKETGRPDERPLVAAVLLNRLRLGMPLQIDSTVIYGLGTQFDGNLTRRDLLTPTPHNTYTRRGLPPTPIALPSAASLQAVMNPAMVDYLYFVGRGDGSHVFSRTLAEHNQAVDCYQRRQAQRCTS
ncbi:MAG: endolytic transglycosylase MltG [Immundisolibacter sp.]|uniref:endolytic transglycosylase MltG n=1 Tax=Immundisolibacter sp. TaxID=1934948 RepID=UPI0019C23CD3|nr:endolytic transglycosylase MltG [Immundisolibacter sp.]MBC7162412.1 endolytic transglycosylase MltG [Immundisolibacter sp.]